MAASKAIMFIALIFLASTCFGQRQTINNLEKILPSLHDSARVDVLNELSEEYLGLPSWFTDALPNKIQLDSSEIFNSEALEEAKKTNYLYGLGNAFAIKAALAFEKYDDYSQEEIFCNEAVHYYKKATSQKGIYKTYWRLGQALYSIGRFNEALKYLDTSYVLSKDAGDTFYSLISVVVSGIVCYDKGDYGKVIEKLLILHELKANNNDPRWKSWEMYQLGILYSGIEEYTTAINYLKQAPADTLELAGLFAINKQFDSAEKYFNSFTPDTSTQRKLRFYLADAGEYYLMMKNNSKAIAYFLRSLEYNNQSKDVNQTMRLLIDISKTYFALHNNDSAFKFAQESITVANQNGARQVIRDSYKIIYSIYDLWNRPDSSYLFYKKYVILNDSLVNNKLNGKLAAFSYDQKIELLNKEKEIQQVRLQKESLQKNIFIAGAIAFLFIAFLLWRNNTHKQKAYLLLQNQKQETDIQKTNAEKTLQELRTTQSQLIQSEKMAALGELTAGIAHEIQNPLNFVNNFSDVNKELIDEALKEIKSGNSNEAVDLLSTLRENEDKINNHGKRADRIVKGMLQHSSATKGQKEPTDINVLADEYLRLSYQGLRARDKTFNATLLTNFDPTIVTINIITHDIGLVFLNLYNNAFYSVSERKKLQPHGYEPTVSVSTSRINGKVEIRVKDNGNGITQKVIDKIFQPFFTTKPTGQGTGLGLSLSYDSIKAHGGEIQVETKEGVGAEFIILLPISA